MENILQVDLLYLKTIAHLGLSEWLISLEVKKIIDILVY